MDESSRLTLLEERYAHLQRHIAQQDKAMLELADEVARLRREIAALRTPRAPLAEPGEEQTERPPHY